MLVTAYLYLVWRLASSTAAQIALALPFAMVWIVPVVYWGSDRDRHGPIDQVVHFASYLSMGWLSFLVILSIARDVLYFATSSLVRLFDISVSPVDIGVPLVIAGSLAMLGMGLLAALRGPHVQHVDIPIENLDAELDGFRIVQISDLHVGLMIREWYVRRVVEMTKALAPDLIAITGDAVDGPVAHFGRHVQALAELPAVAPSFSVLGNHEYYAGASDWVKHFQAMGLSVLMNSRAVVKKGAARMMVAGVTDPAASMYGPRQMPRADIAAGNEAADFRLLLAHNPKLAPAGAKAGFDLQLSGHTHAGQFFPWTLAVRLVHTQHVAGLSREGSMWVYVSAGTGTWGPPVRFGTKPELTVLRLTRATSR